MFRTNGKSSSETLHNQFCLSEAVIESRCFGPVRFGIVLVCIVALEIAMHVATRQSCAFENARVAVYLGAFAGDRPNRLGFTHRRTGPRSVGWRKPPRVFVLRRILDNAPARSAALRAICFSHAGRICVARHTRKPPACARLCILWILCGQKHRIQRQLRFMAVCGTSVRLETLGIEN